MSEQNELVLAYITCADATQAERIGMALLEERLVACVNLLPGLRSRYWWQGRIEESQEVLLVAKTTRTREGAVIGAVRARHSYATPCVVFLPITGGNPAFLEWVRAEVAGSANPSGLSPGQPSATTDARPPG